jgi:outer membrane protein TolC
MRALTKYVLLAVVAVTAWSFGQPPADKAKPEKPEGQANRSLEELLSSSLRNHPDVQVAEAKLREAEAELRRTRLTLAQKLIERHSAVEAQRLVVKSAQAEYEMHVALLKTSTTSRSDERRAFAQLERAKAELAQAEASLNAMP